jgi:hypothetical protein
MNHQLLAELDVDAAAFGASKLEQLAVPHYYSRLQPHLQPCLVFPSAKLSAMLDADIWIASETFQNTGSFKYRGGEWSVSCVRLNSLLFFLLASSQLAFFYLFLIFHLISRPPESAERRKSNVSTSGLCLHCS